MSKVKLIGVPTSVGCRVETSEAMDQHNAPAATRKMLSFILEGYDILTNFDDLGDVTHAESVSSMLQAVKAKVLEIRKTQDIPLLLGGVHTLTLGTLRALHESDKDFSVIYFDAHPDCMPRADINYGSTIFHAVNEGVVDPRRFCYLGTRQIERPEAELIKAKNILSYEAVDFEAFGANHIREQILKALPPPYFMSIDIDAIDPTMAPGVSAPFPGGLTFREVLYLAVEFAKHPMLAVEIVELCPAADTNQQTVKITARLLHAIAAALCG